MKKLVLLGLAFCLVSSMASAQEAAKSAAVTMNGVIIDNACADANQANIAEFAKTHPKSCALMPSCAASGYSIYADGKLTKFDKDSNAKIEEFLKAPDSKTEFAVEAEKIGEELKLVSIKNQ